MLVIVEGSCLLLLLPCSPEQFHYGLGLEILADKCSLPGEGGTPQLGIVFTI